MLIGICDMPLRKIGSTLLTDWDRKIFQEQQRPCNSNTVARYFKNNNVLATPTRSQDISRTPKARYADLDITVGMTRSPKRRKMPLDNFLEVAPHSSILKKTGYKSPVLDKKVSYLDMSSVFVHVIGRGEKVLPAERCALFRLHRFGVLRM